MTSRKGFTLVELLVFIGIMTITSVAFVAILVTIVRLQVGQSGSGEVETQSAALLQQVQYYVQNSSFVSSTVDASASTLTLRMPASSTDPTVISLSNGTVYVKQGSGASQAITSNRVSVSNLSFIRRANPPGHDTVAVAFTMTSNSQQALSQVFQTNVVRAVAATFDSNIIPSASNLTLGSAGNVWSPINGVLTFSGQSVGVNAQGTDASPHAALDVGGGNVYVDGIGYGLLLRDSGGSCWLIKVATSGSLTSNSQSCP